jgi:YidC/Oxa1 family membrane protein insertase
MFTNVPLEQKAENYFFDRAGVESYVNAKIFGVNLGDAIHNASIVGGSGGGWHWHVAPVAIPLMIVASIATHFTARHSVARQNPESATAQTAMMNKMTMYVFPLGVLVFGALFPIGLLLYWLANNGWTLMQQRLVYTRIDREEEAKKAEAIEKRTALGPKPGQKPRPGQKPVQQGNTKSGGSSASSGGNKSKKAGSPHSFAQGDSTKNGTPQKKTAPGDQKPAAKNPNENGTGVPGLINDSTKKSGRKRR